MNRLDLNNAKLMFAKYLPILDEKGSVIDSVLLEANDTFREFFKIESPVGKLRSAILPVSNIGMNLYMQQVMSNGKQISWEYYEEGLGNIQVYMDSSDGGRSINVITTDLFSKKKYMAKVDKEFDEFMYAMDIFGIHIWHLDIIDREFYSNSPLANGNEEGFKRFDEEKNLFVWDLDERFKFIPEDERTRLYAEIDKLANEQASSIAMDFEVDSASGKKVRIEMKGVVESRDETTGKPRILTAYMRIK